MATLKEQINTTIKESLSTMAAMNDAETQSTLTTGQVIEAFQKWLLDQAHKDSAKDFRNTRAYNLYERLRNE